MSTTEDLAAQIDAALRIPRMPFPDPGAHSLDAYVRAVHSAFCEIRFKLIDMKKALAATREPTIPAEGQAPDEIIRLARVAVAECPANEPMVTDWMDCAMKVCRALAAPPSAPQQVPESVCARCGGIVCVDPLLPQQTQAWISVEERMPELHQPVVLLDENRRENTPDDLERHVQAAGYLECMGQLYYWAIRGERANAIDAFTHWLPLPAAPDPTTQRSGGEA